MNLRWREKTKIEKNRKGKRVMCQQDDGLLWSVDLRDFRLEVLRCPL